MIDIEKELHRLSNIQPSTRFVSEAKGRLMHQIQIEPQERWLIRLLNKVGIANPDPRFLKLARARILSQIQSLRQPALGWWLWFKGVAASTLILALAVTTTLFFVGGKPLVVASENTTLEPHSGEVSLKHADRLVWDPVTLETELSAGDLIRTGELAEATLHFFDDSEVRLGQNSILLINKLNVSPAFPRQGVIEVSLHQGSVWVQTLSVEDGSAEFTLSTPNASIASLNATFDVQTNLFSSTQLRVFHHTVAVSALNPDTRLAIASGRIGSGEQVVLDGGPSGILASAALSQPASITDADKASPWVANNLKADQDYLNVLRGRELASLKSTVGTLPGDLLYPLKRARERLELALTFGEKAEGQVLAFLANQRLSEALVLLEQNESKTAEIALADYKNLVDKIVQIKAEDTASEDRLKTLVTAHRKTLVAALPGDVQVDLVNRALNQTQELMADDPANRIQIRLQNSVEELTRIHDLVLAKDYVGAEALLANRKAIISELLSQIALLPSEQQKTLYEAVLESKYQEKQLFANISHQLASLPASETFLALATDQASTLESGLREAVAAVRPTMPEVVLSQAAAFSKAQKAREFAEKVTIYSTWQGQKNQVKRLIAKYPQYAYDLDFWSKVKDSLDGTAKVVIESRIAEVEYQNAVIRSKQIQQKIILAQRLREKREEINQ